MPGPTFLRATLAVFCVSISCVGDEPATTTAGGFTGPASLLVECGDTAIRFDGPKLWTPSRIDFRGTRLGIEDSAYGTVFNLAGVGFIGSAHREVETEAIEGVKFFLDGEAVDGSEPMLRGRSFRCERRSQVRDLSLVSTVELTAGRLTETARVTARRDVRCEKVYHFMHAWLPDATGYCYGRGDDMISSGSFSNAQEDDRKFYFEKEADWVAVFHAASGTMAVSRLLEQPKLGRAGMQLWNVPGVYRKFYFVTFLDETIPAGFDGTYRLTTEFGATTADEFHADARRIAKSLAE